MATRTSTTTSSSVKAYIDNLLEPARAARKDRGFTYITSIAEENAYYEDGANVGYGFRLATTWAGELVVTEVFEGSPAAATSITRGAVFEAVGTSAANQTAIAPLLAAKDYDRLNAFFSPADSGKTIVIRVRHRDGLMRQVSVTSDEFEIDPVSDTIGTRIFTEGSRKIGYVALRSFITPADADLVDAFAQFKAEGVTELVVDLRYNGGGLLSTAEVFGDLLAGNLDGQVFQKLMLRDSKSAQNQTYNFAARPQSITPTKIAFIGTGSTASASEMIINSMVPYLGDNMALIGENTYGKPVGQFAFDNAGCDDRLRLVAFRNANANNQGEYYTGLASTLPRTCVAQDDVSRDLGDQNEAMIAKALDFLAGRSCTPIRTATASTRSVAPAKPQLEMLRDEVRGTTAQREMPGLF
ncbi:S41 family peptidase [Croceibacterium xixiisoli]|nr:S41 family peptidase [Croceibacterium xixiisoli]